MQTDRRQRNAHKRGAGSRVVALFAFACTCTMLPAVAMAERPALPSPMPAGYTIEARGEARFIYPNSAGAEAQELMTELPVAWKRLQRAFGTTLSPELDVRIGLHRDDMRRLAGQPLPSSAGSVSIPADGLVLLSLSASDTWLQPNLQALLVHELTHVALHRAVTGRAVPRWFAEGVSIHHSGQRDVARIRTLWEGTVRHRLIRVEQLSNALPSDHHSVDLASAQSADLVRYMLDGRDERARFRQLIGLLEAGVVFDTAVHRAYHVSLGYLEREWRGQLQQRYGRWPSVLIGLTGVWALAALLLFAAYMRTRLRHRRTLALWAARDTQPEDAEETPTLELQLAVVPAQGEEPAFAAAEGVRQDTEAPLSHVDRILDRALRKPEAEVPTVDHDGHSHTLH